MTGAIVKDAELGHANLTDDANLTGANLSGANLRQATLGGVDMTGAIKYAELRDANLTGANLNDVNFAYTHFDGADFTGTRLMPPRNLTVSLNGAPQANVNDVVKKPNGVSLPWRGCVREGGFTEIKPNQDYKILCSAGDLHGGVGHGLVMLTVKP
jgi:hypothetical protein